MAEKFLAEEMSIIADDVLLQRAKEEHEGLIQALLMCIRKKASDGNFSHKCGIGNKYLVKEVSKTFTDWGYRVIVDDFIPDTSLNDTFGIGTMYENIEIRWDNK